MCPILFYGATLLQHGTLVGELRVVGAKAAFEKNTHYIWVSRTMATTRTLRRPYDAFRKQ